MIYVNSIRLLVCRAVLFFFISIAAAPHCVAAQPEYLRHEILTMSMDGTSALTSLPLDPSRQYRVIVSSPYNLRPLLNPEQFCDYGEGRVVCYPPLLFDGVQLRTVWWGNASGLGSYFFESKYPHFYIPAIDGFFYWGTGKRLSLNTKTDLSADVPTATVEVIDLTFQQEERQRQLQIEQARQQAEQARRRTRRLTILFFVVAGFLVSFISWYGATNKERKARRLRLERGRVLAREQQRQAEEKKLRQLQEQTAHAAGERQRRAALEAVQQEEAAAEEERQRRCKELETYQRELDRLKIEFEDRPHFEDDAWVAQYAEAHLDELLQEREKIISGHHAFHKNPDYIAYLKEHGPQYYRRATWKMRALAAAEAHEVQGKKKQRRTPEEFRENALTWERTKIEDETAMALVAFESVEALMDVREAQIAEINARTDLDAAQKEERIRAIQAITEIQLEKLQGGNHYDQQTPHEPAPVVLSAN